MCARQRTPYFNRTAPLPLLQTCRTGATAAKTAGTRADSPAEAAALAAHTQPVSARVVRAGGSRASLAALFLLSDPTSFLLRLFLLLVCLSENKRPILKRSAAAAHLLFHAPLALAAAPPSLHDPSPSFCSGLVSLFLRFPLLGAMYFLKRIFLHSICLLACLLPCHDSFSFGAGWGAAAALSSCGPVPWNRLR